MLQQWAFRTPLHGACARRVQQRTGEPVVIFCSAFPRSGFIKGGHRMSASGILVGRVLVDYLPPRMSEFGVPAPAHCTLPHIRLACSTAGRLSLASKLEAWPGLGVLDASLLRYYYFLRVQARLKEHDRLTIPIPISSYCLSPSDVFGQYSTWTCTRRSVCASSLGHSPTVTRHNSTQLNADSK